MKTAALHLKALSVNLLVLILLSVSGKTIANGYKNKTMGKQLLSRQTKIENSIVRVVRKNSKPETLCHHKGIKLPNDLDASTRKKLKTSIEKKLMIKINKVLDDKNNITLNAIEVTVDVNGIVAVTKVKGKNLSPDIVTAITRVVEKQDYSKFKMMYFWKYVIEF